MKIKRFATLFLVLVLVSFLVGCGGNDTSDSMNDNSIKEIPLDKEIVLVDNEYITITATAKYEDLMPNFTYYEVGYRVLMENHTDYYVMASYDNLSVDGFMVDDRFSYIDTVAPQKKSYTALAIYVGRNTTYNVVEAIDDLSNTEGTIDISINSDGSNHYSGTSWGGEFHID